MATILENQANISYLYDGITDALGATSNVATTTLADACSVAVTKTPLSATYRNGDNVSFVVRIENTGSAAITTATVTDDLGAGALVYVPDSLQVYVDSAPVTVTPTTAGTSLVFNLPVNIAPGESVIAVYTARVNSTAGTITNTATVTGTGANPAACSVLETATGTITEASFADLAIYKSASNATVISGDTLTYTFTIQNTGNSPATNVVLTDDLPDEFTITSVTVTTDGISRTYASTEYDVDTATNTITLPNATGLAITVPAATAAGPGITTVTITGVVA